MYRNRIKKLLDFIIALKLFLVLLPLFLLVTLFLFIVNNGSPFFVQKRPGKNGKLFNIIKFKTMNDRCDSRGKLLSDKERLTAIGRIIRETSIDEFPQLLNVIMGDMSIVGPRPLLPEYLPLYTDYQRQRHKVKPGITGYAQVNGRNAISWEEKFELDVYYVNHISFPLDLRIIFKTIKRVILRKNITNDNSATTVAFKGSKEK